MYHVIYNGQMDKEKCSRLLETVKGVFAKAGKEVTFHPTEHDGHAREIAAELTRGGNFAHIIAMGGDGTLHQILNGIEDTGNCTLGLIPVGTGNDFAAAAGIPSDVVYAAETIAFRAPTCIDYIELDNGLRSINAVGMGIDVDVLQRAYKGKNKGKHKYYRAFIKSLIHYKAQKYKVTWDDGREKLYTGIIAALGNGRQIGGGIVLFPDAKPDDGYMDLMVVDYLSRIKTFFAFFKLALGKINKIKEVTHVKCKSACIVPIGGGAPLQAEGEIYEGEKLNAKVVEGKLKFYLPKRD